MPLPLPSTDDPAAMRRAGRDLLSLALFDARNHTLDLLTRHADGPAQARAAWLAGHAGWFAERWIGRNPLRDRGRACPADGLRLAPAQPQADAWWESPPAPGQAVPDAPTTRAAMLASLEGTLELLERAREDDDSLYFFRLALFHEDLIGERLVVLAQSEGVPLALEPPPVLREREAVGVAPARWALGSEPGGFAFDNEYAAHPVPVPGFEIDAQAVTWSQYAEFVEDGGYDQPGLWQPEGWVWLQAVQSGPEGRRGPRHVEQMRMARGAQGGAVIQRRFGRAVRPAGSQAVVHVSWWEADAWCRWAGRRLPDEAEWELAAHAAGRRGFRWGEVHEWTASRLAPYPGFVPGPWTDRSVPWFGRARVLRGGSWVTRARLRHPKFRGFALPGDDEGFHGFRSCAL